MSSNFLKMSKVKQFVARGKSSHLCSFLESEYLQHLVRKISQDTKSNKNGANSKLC